MDGFVTSFTVESFRDKEIANCSLRVVTFRLALVPTLTFALETKSSNQSPVEGGFFWS